MPDKPNRLSRFWQELKRRKVIYVITVYASASFVLIELVNNVLEPLSLPENLSTIVIIALAVGFPIVLVLSWIFDVTPKGIEKTGPVDEETDGKKVVTSNAWRITTYASVVIIAALVIFNIFTRNQLSDSLTLYGKSIAVLPFINDGLVTEEHFINGTMGTIQGKLCMIKDLRVASRTSVEQYRNVPKPIPEIAKDLNVSYILDGAGQKSGDQFRLTLHLMDNNGKQLWSISYDREIRPINAFFSLQSEIAQLVAREVKAILTPEEKQRMEKVPTISFEAYDAWSQGMHEVMNAKYNHGYGYANEDHRGRAELLFKKALEIDSTFAPAYSGLGWICYDDASTRGQPEYLDTMLIWASKALLYDDELADAYHLRALYYQLLKNGFEKALTNVNKALELDPNHDVAYNLRGNLYAEFSGDFVRAIEDFEEDLSRNRGSMLPRKLRTLGNVYQNIGFPEISKSFFDQKLTIDGNESDYYMNLLFDAYENGDIQTMFELEKKMQEIIPDYRLSGFLAMAAGLDDVVLQETQEAIEEFGIPDIEDEYPDENVYPYAYIMGYGLWLMGEYEKADYFFMLEILKHEENLKKNEPYMHSGISIDAAKAYAFTGDTEKACGSLEALHSRYRIVSPFLIAMIRLSPLFDPIRDEPCYQNIIQKMEANRKAEHDRVRRWLEETGRMEKFSHLM